MIQDDDGNKAGDTKTSSKEYVKLETGEQDTPRVPTENSGLTSTSQDDLDHPEQQKDEETDESNDAVAEKIKDTNHQD